MMTDKTIKELADELNVSKDKIKYRIKSLPSELTSKKNGITYIKNEGVKEIKRVLTGKETREKPGVLPSDYLGKQLDVKDEQIKQKDKQIDKLQSLLDQQQILTLQANKKIEQLEYQSEEKEESVSQTEISEKKSWFSKLFK